jgi:hypothetical protein
MHEYFHSVQLQGFTAELLNENSRLYNLYSVAHAFYNTVGSYAFSNDIEFFAEMGQVFNNVTVRLDLASTGGITREIMRTRMPELFQVMTRVFGSTNNMKVVTCSIPCAKSLPYCLAEPVNGIVNGPVTPPPVTPTHQVQSAASIIKDPN